MKSEKNIQNQTTFGSKDKLPLVVSLVYAAAGGTMGAPRGKASASEKTSDDEGRVDAW